MIRKLGKPSSLGITKASGMCVACGKPRASIPYIAGGKALWIHARCQIKPARLDEEKNAKPQTEIVARVPFGERIVGHAKVVDYELRDTKEKK